MIIEVIPEMMAIALGVTVRLTWMEEIIVLRAKMVALSLTLESRSNAPCVSRSRMATCNGQFFFFKSLLHYRNSF